MRLPRCASPCRPVKSIAGVNKWVKPRWQRRQPRRGLDPAASATSSSRASSISEGCFWAPPARFLGLWPAELCWCAGSLPYGSFSWMCFLQLRRNVAQMSLEAVLHLSGVPSYVVSLLVMLQMRLLLGAVPEVCRAHTQRFAQLQEVTVLPHVTCHTGNNQPSTSFGSLQKKVRFSFSLFF